MTKDNDLGAELIGQTIPESVDTEPIPTVVAFGGYRMRVWDYDDHTEVWLDTEVAECDGLVIGTAKTRSEALKDARNTLIEMMFAINDLMYGPDAK